jgi:hypothetical protein
MRDTFLTNFAQIEHKISTWNSVFPRGQGTDNLIFYSVWLHDEGTHKPVEYVSTVYTVHIHFYTVYIYFYTIYLFISNAIKM